MKILVTGGAGYIGSHTVMTLLAEGHDVTVFDNFCSGLRSNLFPEAKLIEGDLLNPVDLSRAFAESYDAVIHFSGLKAAGESMFEPKRYYDYNITGSVNLINIACEKKVKYFVFSSSAAVYGEPLYLPIDEQHPLNPTNYYGYTKLAIEQNLDWFSRLHGIKFAALRYFNAAGYNTAGRIKGKEKNPNNLLPIVLEVAAGTRSKLAVFGKDYKTPDGTCIRDYIHVDDLALAHNNALNYLQNHEDNLILNLGTGKGHSVLEVIEKFQEISGINVDFEFLPRRKGDAASVIAGYKLAAEKIGFVPQFSSLENMLNTMLPVYL